MATGILLLLAGAFIVLRTVAPGQDRNLVDLILGGGTAGSSTSASSGASSGATPTTTAPDPATAAQDADPHATGGATEHVPGYRGRI